MNLIKTVRLKSFTIGGERTLQANAKHFGLVLVSIKKYPKQESAIF